MWGKQEKHWRWKREKVQTHYSSRVPPDRKEEHFKVSGMQGWGGAAVGRERSSQVLLPCQAVWTLLKSNLEALMEILCELTKPFRPNKNIRHQLFLPVPHLYIFFNFFLKQDLLIPFTRFLCRFKIEEQLALIFFTFQVGFSTLLKEQITFSFILSMNFMATLCERMRMETYNTIFTIAFLIIFAPQDVTPEIILLLLCHFKVISNTKKKKKSLAWVQSWFHRGLRGMSDIFSLYAINVSFS